MVGQDRQLDLRKPVYPELNKGRWQFATTLLIETQGGKQKINRWAYMVVF